MSAVWQLVVYGCAGDGSRVAVSSTRVFPSREAALGYLPEHRAVALAGKLTRVDGHCVEMLALEEAPRREMTLQEVTEHGLAIASAKTKEHFVAAFAAYVADVCGRETDPHAKIAQFVHGMVEGLLETVEDLMKCRGGGSA